MRGLLLLFLAQSIFAQVTLKVTSLPSNTPAGASVYLAGSVNSWNPGNASYILAPDGLGNLLITIPEGTGTVEYKFTRGSWPTVEGGPTGGFIPNRTFTFNGSPQIIELTIQSWEDLGGNSGSTAAANVSVLNSSFYIPQLDRYRRVWIYLPPDYEISDKHYPVLYMQDGQNLFDSQTSFSGEWEVDETLNDLFAAGDFGAIVIGIDNGGAERLNEYSPWNNPSYGGGQGDQYAAFLAETLKPYVDANYRTRPEPQFNALIGSSMGALISTYGSLEHPEAFLKIGSLSPAYWFSMGNFQNYINNLSTSLQGHRAYFVAGQNESSTMVSHMNTVSDAMQAKGLLADNTMVKVDSYGTHTESYWRGEFSALYQWLFENENLAVQQAQATAANIYQDASGRLFASGLQHPIAFTIYDMSARKVGAVEIFNGEYALNGLSKGVYFLRENSRKLAFKIFVR